MKKFSDLKPGDFIYIVQENLDMSNPKRWEVIKKQIVSIHPDDPTLEWVDRWYFTFDEPHKNCIGDLITENAIYIYNSCMNSYRDDHYYSDLDCLIKDYEDKKCVLENEYKRQIRQLDNIINLANKIKD